MVREDHHPSAWTQKLVPIVQKSGKMIQFTIHHNTQSLKNPRGRMEVRARRPFHYPLNYVDQRGGGSDRGYSTGTHQRAGKRGRCAFFSQLAENLPQFALTCLVYDIRGAPILALVHAHI
jgi:hypothetical protein